MGDIPDPMLLSEEQACATYPLLRVMPAEYLDVLPWRLVAGQRRIDEDDLLSWCADGDFAARASGALREREDAAWIEAQRRESAEGSAQASQE